MATLNNCHAIFTSNQSQGCFVFGNDTQRHVNKGAQQIGEHRLGHQIRIVHFFKVTKFQLASTSGSIISGGLHFAAFCKKH